MDKKILVYPYKVELHNVYCSTLEFLRKNCKLIYSPIKTKRINWFTKLSRNLFALSLYHKILRPFVSVNSLKRLFSGNNEAVLPECDLIFCAGLLPPNTEKKFIIDLESVMALSGYDLNRLDKEKVKRFFSHTNCKAVICWNEISKKSLIETINCSDFMDKIKVLPFGINPEKIKKDFKNEKINLLFVSSINNPLDFERKGGIIALEAYALLVKKYLNLKFVIRAHVPKWVKRKYGPLKGIKFIDKFVSDEVMKRIMKESNILFEPLPGINLALECMSFGIPVIAIDFWAIPEMIKDGKNGFIINADEIFGKKDMLENYMQKMNINYLKMYGNKPSREIVNGFFKAAEKLISEQKLREKMSKYAKNFAQPEAANKIAREIINIALSHEE